MDKTDSEIIRDYLNGDESLFAVLMNRHMKAVYNFVHRLVPKNIDVDDIVSETFFKVWKNLKKFCDGENFTTWLFTIARNTAVDKMRKKSTIAFSQFDNEDGGNYLTDQLQDTEPLAIEIFEHSENHKKIQNAIEELPLLYKEVILLRYVHEFTFDDMGIVLGKPLDTVKSQHRRALILLKKSFPF